MIYSLPRSKINIGWPATLSHSDISLLLFRRTNYTLWLNHVLSSGCPKQSAALLSNVEAPHKEPVMRKALPCHDVIMQSYERYTIESMPILGVMYEETSAAYNVITSTAWYNPYEIKLYMNQLQSW